MDAPLVSWLCLFAFALPVFAAARRRESVDRPMLLVACWYAFHALWAALAVLWSHYIDRTNNLVVSLVGLPIEATFVLGALAEWQVQPVARSAVRLFIPLYWVLWAVLLGFVILSWRKQAALDARLAALESAVAKAGDQPARGKST